MRRALVSMLSVLLVLLGTPDGASAVDSSLAGATPRVPLLTADSNSVAPVSDDIAIRRLQGEPAMGHVRRLQADSRKGVGLAAAALARRGFRPTAQAWAVQTVRLSVGAGPSSAGPSAQLAEDRLSDPEEGEVVFWSWDDGYDGTWEGVIYVENYNNSGSVTYEAQIDIETDGDYQTVFCEVTGYEKPRPGPIEARNSQQREFDHHAFMKAALEVMNAKRVQARPWGKSQRSLAASAQYQLAQFDPAAYYWCVFWGCLAAAVGCSFLGPAAPPCFFAGCTAAFIYCIPQAI